MAGWTPGVAPTPPAGAAIHHPVGADTAEQAHRYLAKQPRQAHDVVAGIHHEQDRRVVRPPLPGLGQPRDQRPDLCGVTAVRSSSGPSRTTSNGHVHDERPPASATATW